MPKNLPAFPGKAWSEHSRIKIDREGMTLRDYFAAKAMHAWVSKQYFILDEKNFPYMAKGAYQIADAMLVEREK